jgi:hypothetical protein
MKYIEAYGLLMALIVGPQTPPQSLPPHEAATTFDTTTGRQIMYNGPRLAAADDEQPGPAIGPRRGSIVIARRTDTGDRPAFEERRVVIARDTAGVRREWHGLQTVRPASGQAIYAVLPRDNVLLPVSVPWPHPAWSDLRTSLSGRPGLATLLAPHVARRHRAAFYPRFAESRLRRSDRSRATGPRAIGRHHSLTPALGSKISSGNSLR